MKVLSITLFVSLVLLSGCTRSPKINDVTNQLLIKRELIKIESYGEKLKSEKENLLSTTKYFEPKMEKPESRVESLVPFLTSHDCTQFENTQKDECYRRTRVMLIETTKSLDDSAYRVYYLNRSVGLLRANISTIIDNYPEIKY